MHAIAGKVDSTPEHIQHTSIDVYSTKHTELFIHLFWISTPQLRNTQIPEIRQGLGKPWADPGNTLEVS